MEMKYGTDACMEFGGGGWTAWEMLVMGLLYIHLTPIYLPHHLLLYLVAYSLTYFLTYDTM